MTKARDDVLLSLACLSVAAIGAAFYFAFVSKFGVNVLFWDEWAFVGWYKEFSTGRMSLWSLIGIRHSDHLVAVPFALMLFQHLVTDMNSKGVQYTDALLQCVALFFFVVMLPRPKERLRSIVLVTAPSTLLLLSLPDPYERMVESNPDLRDALVDLWGGLYSFSVDLQRAFPLPDLRTPGRLLEFAENDARPGSPYEPSILKRHATSFAVARPILSQLEQEGS